MTHIRFFKTGSQVRYVPLHARGDINHPDCEDGFVVVVNQTKHQAMCRFWSKQQPNELRTKANNERVAVDHLVLFNSHDQSFVNATLKQVTEIESFVG